MVDVDNLPRLTASLRGESVPITSVPRLRLSNVNTCAFIIGDAGECGVMFSVAGEVSLPDAEPSRRRLMR